MSVTHTAAARSAATDAVTALIGASGHLKFRLAGTVGAPGTIVANLTLAATAFAAAVSGTATANAIGSDTNATGNASPVANASLQTSGGTLVIHCDVAATVTPTISGASGAATMTVGSASGIVVGMNVSGTGVATGARVVNVNGTTITVDKNNTGALSGNGTFTGDIAMTNGLVVANGDTVSCSALTYTALGA